mmetsp:Transcript_35149/g.71658  ORF Transcript_35149/g.71658 Transcript_35149/m.71658 type:complete len:146 (-) Transcript_35149:238-675(-)
MADPVQQDENEISPEEIISRFKAMRNEIKKLTNKVDELEAEFNEHQLVIDSISKLESGRKAFRLVGGVLIQQTVGDVLPAVTSHQSMVKQLLEKVMENLNMKEKESMDWKVKYNIQTQQERELNKTQTGGKLSPSPPTQNTGVLA